MRHGMNEEDCDQDKKLTPYQGKRRSFGDFKCQVCSRLWYSSYSWANCGQECMICYIMVYPFRQRKLKRRLGHVNPSKPHLESLCGKCKQLGHPCKVKP